MANLTLRNPGQLIGEIVNDVVDLDHLLRKNGAIEAGDFQFVAREVRHFFDALVSELPGKQPALPHSVSEIVGSLLHHEHNVPGVTSDFLLH
ncbi:MAG: hypothetical protein WDO17_03775 [Alphaproteobacteria bacterium]